MLLSLLVAPWPVLIALGGRGDPQRKPLDLPESLEPSAFGMFLVPQVCRSPWAHSVGSGDLCRFLFKAARSCTTAYMMPRTALWL